MAPLTHEQLDFFSEQTQHAVRKSVKRYSRVALVGFLFLLAGLGWALHVQGRDADSSRHAIVQSGRAVAVDSCNGRYQDREGLRNLLVSAENQIPGAVKRGELSPRQEARALAFYNDQLEKLKLPDCRRAARIITSNPDKTVKIPPALYPPAAPVSPLHDSIPQG